MPEVETVTSSESCNIHCSNLTFYTTAILLLQDPLFFPRKIQLQYSLELPLRWPTDQLTAQLLIAIQDSETPFFYQPSSIHRSNPLINTSPKTSPHQFKPSTHSRHQTSPTPFSPSPPPPKSSPSSSPSPPHSHRDTETSPKMAPVSDSHLP